MEFFYSLEFAVPVSQIALLLTLSTLALLFGRIKLALMISYLFTLHWGYFINRELFVTSVSQGQYIVLMYFGFGITVAVFALVGFLFQHE